MQAAVRELQDQLQAEQLKVARLQGGLAAATQEVTKLRGLAEANTQAEGQLQAQQQEAERLQGQLQATTQEVTQLRGQLAAANTQAQAQLQAKQQEVTRLQDELPAANTQAQQQRVARLQAELAAANQRAEAAQQEVAKLKVNLMDSVLEGSRLADIATDLGAQLEAAVTGAPAALCPDLPEDVAKCRREAVNAGPDLAQRVNKVIQEALVSRTRTALQSCGTGDCTREHTHILMLPAGRMDADAIRQCRGEAACATHGQGAQVAHRRAAHWSGCS